MTAIEELEKHKKELEDDLEAGWGLHKWSELGPHVSACNDAVAVDLRRHLATERTNELLIKLGKERGLEERFADMLAGGHVNTTEDRPALHVALRAPTDSEVGCKVDSNPVRQASGALDKVRNFVKGVRAGQTLGATGKRLMNVIVVGIGGSYLGPLFAHEALEQCFHKPEHPVDGDYDDGLGPVSPYEASRGRTIRYLANVDPVAGAKAVSGLDPEGTLVIVVSKTFTTAETMANARFLRQWLVETVGEGGVAKHMVAVSTALDKVEEFGLDPAKAFPFWDWVGGRYSVTSSVGILPLALQYGFGHAKRLLQGAWDMDCHAMQAPMESNAPMLMALYALWNRSFWRFPAHATLPYSEALAKFPLHVQQVEMESNGKSATVDPSSPFTPPFGEIEFGEAGTNGQHSFYQSLHQGCPVPADFIGTIECQLPFADDGNVSDRHMELLANFFAQQDALALGRHDPDPHRSFPGNRPSSSILLRRVDAYHCGALTSLYEHRCTCLGFLWGNNPFDQFGVELGKSLAKRLKPHLRDGSVPGQSDASSSVTGATREAITHLHSMTSQGSQ